jgi:hypothetical protein
VFGILALVAIPVGNILRRTGHNYAWCVFSVVPFVNFVLLWIFAFKPWPIDSKSQSA